jgi:hypothetical protein
MLVDCEPEKPMVTVAPGQNLPVAIAVAIAFGYGCMSLMLQGVALRRY